MKLIVISAPDSKEEEIAQVKTMFDEGLEYFHLRKPKYSTAMLSDYIRGFPEDYRSRISIHSHHELAVKFQLRGIHITRSHKSKTIRTWLKMRLLKYQRPDLQLSTSLHRLSGLYKNRYGKRMNYVFLSPVFGSISKRGHEAGFDESQLRAAILKTTHSVVALGGMDENKVQIVKNLGFSGMAFLGAIWGSEDPLKAFRKIKSAVDGANQEVKQNHESA